MDSVIILDTLSTRDFIAVKRHHNHSNSNEGKPLIGRGLQFQRCIVHYHHCRAWRHAGRHGSLEGSENGEGATS